MYPELDQLARQRGEELRLEANAERLARAAGSSLQTVALRRRPLVSMRRLLLGVRHQAA